MKYWVLWMNKYPSSIVVSKPRQLNYSLKLESWNQINPLSGPRVFTSGQRLDSKSTKNWSLHLVGNKLTIMIEDNNKLNFTHIQAWDLSTWLNNTKSKNISKTKQSIYKLKLYLPRRDPNYDWQLAMHAHALTLA